MSQSISSNFADINQVDTNRLQVNQESTDLRWDTRLSHPDIIILNSGATVKLPTKLSGTKGVLGTTGYLIGTATESISYKINQGSVIHVGFAEESRDLSSVTASTDLVSKQLSVTADTIVYLDLSATELKITYNSTTTSIDLTTYAGKTMYPWLSDDEETGGMSVTIHKTVRLSVYVNTEGKVVFETSSSNGVDRPIKFDTGSASLEFTGGQLISDTIHNVIESDPGTPMVLRETGGSDVTINASGTVTATGDIICTNVESDSVSGTSTLSLSSGGGNATLSSTGGDIVLHADGAGVSIASTTGDVTFDSTATATSFVSDSIQSTLGGNLTLYEQTGGGGLIIANATSNAQFSADLAVLGSLEVNSVASQPASDLDLIENSGLGLHVATGSGVVTSDSLIVAPEIRAADTEDLQLHNWAGTGLEIKDTTGDAVFDSTVSINSTLTGSSSLNLHNNAVDASGITIDAVSGDVNCDSSLNVGGHAVVVGTASVGPTPVDAGICFAASDGAGAKAMLLPRTASHAAISPVQAGMIVFNTSDQTLRLYNGATWQTLATL